jgi:hypothetical protein
LDWQRRGQSPHHQRYKNIAAAATSNRKKVETTFGEQY